MRDVRLDRGHDGGALGDRSSCCVLEVLEKVLGREVRERAEPDVDLRYAGRPLCPGSFFERWIWKAAER